MVVVDVTVLSMHILGWCCCRAMEDVRSEVALLNLHLAKASWKDSQLQTSNSQSPTTQEATLTQKYMFTWHLQLSVRSCQEKMWSCSALFDSGPKTLSLIRKLSARRARSKMPHVLVAMCLLSPDKIMYIDILVLGEKDALYVYSENEYSTT